MVERMPLHIRPIQDRRQAEMVVAALVTESAWFEVIPLPDNIWVIKVRADRGRTLDELIGRYEGGTGR